MSDKSLRTLGAYAGMIAAALLLVGPFLIMVLGSFRKSELFLSDPFFWWPSPFTLSNYVTTFNTGLFPRWLLNSAVISIVPVCLIVFISTLLGYIFARRKFFGREVIFWVLMGVIMVPQQLLLIPRYMMFSKLGWIDTYWVFIIPNIWDVTALFLVRQYLQSIPYELEEAAEVDGATDWQLIWKVIVPLAKPAMATVATFQFIMRWNAFLQPLVYTSQRDMFPLTVGLATLVQKQGNFGLQMAGATVAFLPTVIVYIALQRYFTEGLAMSGLKG